jgi:hypothetical protein
MNTSVTIKYPTLARMGVESPKQIGKYYVTSINAIDVLRIVYDRPEDSFLPSSRSYKFPRVQVSSATEGKETVEERALRMHPMLRDALKELESVMEAISTKENIVAEILSEIELLEEDIAIRSECLKVLAGKIPDVDC